MLFRILVFTSRTPRERQSSQYTEPMAPSRHREPHPAGESVLTDDGLTISQKGGLFELRDNDRGGCLSRRNERVEDSNRFDEKEWFDEVFWCAQHCKVGK